MKTIQTSNAPAAIGPYSQAKVVNGFVFASGQIPLNPATGEVEGTTIEAQAEQVMKNVGAILKEAGVGFENVVKTTCFLRRWQILRHSIVFMKNTLPASQPVPALL